MGPFEENRGPCQGRKEKRGGTGAVPVPLADGLEPLTDPLGDWSIFGREPPYPAVSKRGLGNRLLHDAMRRICFRAVMPYQGYPNQKEGA